MQRNKQGFHRGMSARCFSPIRPFSLNTNSAPINLNYKSWKDFSRKDDSNLKKEDRSLTKDSQSGQVEPTPKPKPRRSLTLNPEDKAIAVSCFPIKNLHLQPISFIEADWQN